MKSIVSHIGGSPETILQAQLSPLRYYQRPDAGHVKVDPNRTGLSGHGGTITFGKAAGGHFRYSSGVTWRSPGLELNDIGYLREADTIMQWVWVGYHHWQPFSIFRNIRLDFNQKRGWDFSGKNTFDQGDMSCNVMFKNQWFFYAGIQRQMAGISNTALRGGPALRIPGLWKWWYGIRSNDRKAFYLDMSVSHFWGDQAYLRLTDLLLGLNFRPTSAVYFSLTPAYTSRKDLLQYVCTRPYNNENRFILAAINQKTFHITMQLDISITPDLSIQFYGQPFISTGKYSQVKRVTQPLATRIEEGYDIYRPDEIYAESNSGGKPGFYNVDENLDGVIDYRFDNPDFTSLQFNFNLVIRWEYTPGSTLYLVWSQNRNGQPALPHFNPGDNFRDLFNLHPRDIFFLKFSYRFKL